MNATHHDKRENDERRGDDDRERHDVRGPLQTLVGRQAGDLASVGKLCQYDVVALNKFDFLRHNPNFHSTHTQII
jgi:hypothetical protein